MSKIEFARSVPARDGTVCYKCGQFYEIMLLVPTDKYGGNRRRFVRHYSCDCCKKTFCRYDFVFLARSCFRHGLRGFVGSLVASLRPTGRRKRAFMRVTCEQGAVEPITKWVKKSQFRSRRLANQRPVTHLAEPVRRDFIRIESQMPIHLA